MRRVGLLVLIVVGLAWPLLVPRYFVFLASLVLVNAIVAMGLNLLSGYTHQLSFGHAGFLAIGAYTTALLGLHARGLPAPLALLGAGVVTAAVGVALGLPCLRLEGLYLTMATLAFGFVVTEAILNLDRLTNGADGLRVPAARLGPWALTTDATRYYLVVVVTALLVVAALNVTGMRVGRALLAIRESEIAAQASGVLFLSVDFVVMIILGGLGSIPGSIVGAAVVTLLNDVLAGFQNYRPLIFGSVLIGCMLFMPGGIASAWRRQTAS